MKKKMIIFFSIVPIILFFSFLFFDRKTGESKKNEMEFYHNFKVKVSGVVVNKKETGHGYAKIKVKISKSNIDSYIDTVNKSCPYCIIKHDTAYFFGPFNSKIMLYDYITIGPNDSIKIVPR
jgi:hypothetical protein